MLQTHLQILPAPDGTSFSGRPDNLIRFTAADLAARTEPLKARIAELEVELAWYRNSRLGAIDDEEIQTIISNL